MAITMVAGRGEDEDADEEGGHSEEAEREESQEGCS